MHLISKFNKITCFLLSVIDIFSKYAWVIPLKYEKDMFFKKSLMNLIAKQTNNFDKKNSKEDPKFKFDDHARVSK